MKLKLIALYDANYYETVDSKEQQGCKPYFSKRIDALHFEQIRLRQPNALSDEPEQSEADAFVEEMHR